MNVLGVIATAEAAEAAGPAGSQADWVAQVLLDLARAQVTEFILDVCKWTLLGALVGAMMAVGGCFLFSRLGWYDIRRRFARGLRWTLYVATVILGTILLGLAGFWEGALQGSERVLTRSRLATDVFPLVGDAIADSMAWVQVRAGDSGMTNSPELTARLEEFRAGRWELQAAEFLRQLDQMQNATITNTIASLEQSALKHAPQLRGGLGELFLHQFLTGFGQRLRQGNVPGLPQSWGPGRILAVLREQLITEAAKSGNTETIGRTELSGLILKAGIVPGLLQPIRVIARAQQLLLLIVAVLVILVPPGCIRLAGRWLGPAAGAASVPPSPPPGSP